MEEEKSVETTNICSFLGMTAIVRSPAMQRVIDTARLLARSSAAVLITGETGSGKELVARAIHHYSARSSAPWIDVNCAALPDHLLESELFGYEKGAFSGADSLKRGLYELADGGTLFLDEIGELDQKMQVKLLRVLDGTPYYRLGGTRKVTANVRIIAATNADLREAVDKGTFRRDLYYRLDQVRLQVPALRARTDDIEALACYFLEKEAPHLSFSPAAMEILREYSWPGNVRELRNAVVKAALMSEEEIGAAEVLAVCGRPAPRRSAAVRTLDEIEQQAIENALSQTGGRQDRAAMLLGISRRTLIRKLKVYGAQKSEAHAMHAIAC